MVIFPNSYPNSSNIMQTKQSLLLPYNPHTRSPTSTPTPFLFSLLSHPHQILISQTSPTSFVAILLSSNLCKPSQIFDHGFSSFSFGCFTIFRRFSSFPAENTTADGVRCLGVGLRFRLCFSKHFLVPTSFSSFLYFPLSSARSATVVATSRRDSRRFPATLDLFFIRKPCKHLYLMDFWILR